ncbi:MAG: BON domain-containing protein, partial [Cyanobacteria bacterium J06648_11]
RTSAKAATAIASGDTPLRSEELRDRYAPVQEAKASTSERKGVSPLAIAVAALALVLAIWGGGRWLSFRLGQTVESALFANPELSVYRLNADAKRGLFHPFGAVTLSGRVPEVYLSQKAEELSRTQVPHRARVVNDIFAVETPVNPVLAAEEVERAIGTLNRQDGIDIEAAFEAGRVTVRGTVTDVADAEAIAQTFARIPGVRYVTNVAVLSPLSLPTRIYFGAGAAQVPPTILDSKLERVREFLSEYPDTRLRVIGHSDATGDPRSNEQLALRRAQTVKYALELSGVDPARLEVAGLAEPPPGVDAEHPLWLGRSVRFVPLRPLRAPALR